MEKKLSNIEKYHEDAKWNKNAFDDVIGDPFAYKSGQPEPVNGHYMKLQSLGVIKAQMYDNIGQGTRNPAQPNIQDFLCDVDRIVSNVFENEPDKYKKFIETYIYETVINHYTPKERMQIEQQLGKLFRRYKLSPVSKYFQVIRKGRKQNGNTGTSSRERLCSRESS